MKKMSMKQFKALNQGKGYYFFSQETMRFFNSKIETGLLDYGYFITSEQFGRTSEDGSEYVFPRYFKIRQGDLETGNVNSLPYHSMTTNYKKDRKDCIKRLTKLIQKMQKIEAEIEKIQARIRKTDQKAEVQDLELGLSELEVELKEARNGSLAPEK